MFILFTILLSFYALYCLSFWSLFLYTAIIEEWWCKNKIPNLVRNIKNNKYQTINSELEIV